MNLLDDNAHRPWPIPSKKWIMRQPWRNLLFTHWPIPAETLRPHIPLHLEIDTFDGYAWLGVILFVMEGIYPRGLSSVSLTPKFSEINVRTYVQCDGKPGIFFMSLDVEDWASYIIAKKWFRLPYHSAQISLEKKGQTFHCQSIRKGKTNTPIRFNAKYAPIPEVYFPEKGTLDHWLTERYCLYSTDNGVNIYCGEIHHRPWPLQKVEAEICTNTLFTPFNFDLTEVKPLFHFSKGVDTLIWNIKKTRF
ncbi:YqjF family protein [Peribacillus simplex]|uniref:YqjF family protein n=1 Tax=Peribacillus simplex TaxID=1478 RepID=UPI00366A8359